MGTVSQKLQYLIGTKNAIKTAIEGKGVSVPANTAFRQYATLIDSITTSEQNVPEEYTTLLNTALTLYTGEFSHLMILHEAPYTTFGFLLTDFYVNSYWSTTSEFTAGKWVAVKYDNSLEQWTTQDWSGNDAVSLGGNYAKNIVYCDRSIWYFDIKLYPVGTSGTPASGGAELNIAYGDTAPEDTSKLWIQTEEPTKVEISDRIAVDYTDETGDVYELTELSTSMLPTEAYGIASALVGTKIYLFGGNNGTLCLNTINVFDTETDTIVTLATTLPSAAYDIAAAAVGTKIYLFGGRYNSSYFDTINVFDTETDTIVTLATTLPSAATKIAAAAVGTKIYLFGGVGSSYLKSINVFDTISGNISTLAKTLPSVAYGVTATTVGTKIYLFGGYYPSSYLRSINVFDTVSGNISTLATTLPSGSSGIASASVGTKIYLFGGEGSSSAIYVFNTETNTIAAFTISGLVVALPSGASGIASASVGTKIYLFGGHGSSNYKTIYKMSVGSHILESGTVLILSFCAGNKFKLMVSSSSDIEVGVENVYKGNSEDKGEEVPAYLYKNSAWTRIN